MGGTIVVPATTATFPGSGTQTFAQIKSDISRIAGLLDDPGMQELAGRFLNDIIDDLNRRQVWTFNLVTSPDITTVPGTASYNLPSDFWSLYLARKTDSIDYSLSTLRQKTFDTLFQSQLKISGYPYVAVIANTFRGGTIQLFPTPDGTYTIQLRYFRLIPRLSTDADTLDLPRPYDNIPRYGATSRIMATLSQYDGAKYWSDLYEQAYQTMKRADENAGMDDEELRFIGIEEIASRGIAWLSPAARPRAYDLF